MISSSFDLMGFFYFSRLKLCFSFIFILYPVVTQSAKKGQPIGPVINVTKYLSYPDFSSIDREINLLGSAIFAHETRCIQIPDTSQKLDVRHLAGRAIYSSPVRLFDPTTRKPASFETTFSFQFSSSNSNNQSSDFIPGDGGDGGSGLAFIIAPDEFTVGRPGPWLGMLNDACDDDYKAVGIEFDTRWNPEFGDPNDNHVGINLGSIVSTATFNASDVGVYLNDGSTHRAWIVYNSQSRYMDVRLGSDGEDYPSKPIFSGPLDLSPYLNEYMFVGFSASTGNFTQIHNVFSWNFTSTSQASLRIPSTESCESKIIIDSSERSKSAHNKMPSSFLIFVAVVVLLLAVLLNLYCNRKRKEKKSDELVTITEKEQRPRPPNKPCRFTITEISTATRCFSELQKLGNDSRGVTYRGTSSNGSQVAVKRFSAQFLNSGGHDRRRIAKEIRVISQIRHPNLVPIRGWCSENRETMVVYDYLPNGSLDKWLFGVGVLPWTRRFKVVRDVADALSHLHSKQLAHKNVKTTSVFLDISFRAVLGDFGFVLSLVESERFESMVSQKADVFDFGILMLEVVAGRRKSRSDPKELDLLGLSWAMHERDEKARVVDQRMGSVVNLEQAVRVLEIGLLCTLNENKGRPSMEEVVGFLSGEVPIPELPLSRPVALFPYNSSTGLCIGYSCAPFK